MSSNDRDISLVGAHGVDTYPGVANPTKSSHYSGQLAANFVNDPTLDESGAGAGSYFEGYKDAPHCFKESAGVVEGRPGIIESTNIGQTYQSFIDNGWANAHQNRAGNGSTGGNTLASASTAALNAATVAAGAARVTYGHLTGDEVARQAGEEAIWGQ